MERNCTRASICEVPAEIIALFLDELDATDLGRLASVSRAFRDILSAPATWERLARKALEVEGYGPLPCSMSRAVIAQQHIHDALKRKDRRGTPVAPGSEKKHKTSWEDDWSLPLCSWLSEPHRLRLKT